MRGLNQTPFVGRFTKSEVKEHGVFNTGDSASTVELIKRLLIGFFTYVSELLPEEWQRPQKEGALLTINDGITAQIMLAGDIVQHMVKVGEVKPLADPMDGIVDKITTYVDGLRPYFDKLSDAERAELRSKYGSGAPTRLRRIFQRAVHAYRDDFRPEGLEDYWRDQSKQYNIDTYRRVADIELKLREEIKEALSQQYGSMWLKRGLPEKLYTDLSTEAAKKNRTIEDPAEEKTPWDCLNLIHLRIIMSHGSHWSTLFQKKFTIPGEESRKKDDKTAWLARLNAIRNKADHEYSVTKEEADYVAAVHDWLMLGSSDAIERYSAGVEPAPEETTES